MLNIVSLSLRGYTTMSMVRCMLYLMIVETVLMRLDPPYPYRLANYYVSLFIYLFVLPSLTVFSFRDLKHTNKPVDLKLSTDSLQNS